MLASLKWIKEYVSSADTPEVLADKLTRAGIPVEYITDLGAGIEKVVTGKVTAITHHPDADKLWVCSIDVGSEEVLQILTGAQNVKEGAIVPVAVVGSVLPGGMKLKKAKMRGLYSYGMLCSAAELGIDQKVLLPEEREGILLLPADTAIGKDIKEILGLDDLVFDFDLTANRGDCFNMLGLAREVAAINGVEVKMPSLIVHENGADDVKELISVKSIIPELCPRFAVRVLKNINIGPSPLWLQNRLRACGIRPINNVVDVTNFVMLELGQPMHAYDYDKVEGQTLIVRTATAGEKLTTLDGQVRSLKDTMIVIADAKKVVGVGGVMGGLETEVTTDTKNVILEAATFDGVSVRRTSRALGLRSEASGRFERGVDTARTWDALNRAAYLLELIASAQTVSGIVEDYPLAYKERTITICPEKIAQRIGIAITKEEMIELLDKLSFKVQEQDTNLMLTIPTWRPDVTCAADISEEIARLHGLDNIQSKMPKVGITKGAQHASDDVQDTIKDYLVATGLNEVINYTFINATAFDKIALTQDDERRNVIEIMNPITDEFKVMRTTLIPGILNTVSYNLARQSGRVAIFEVGRVYVPTELPLQNFPAEKNIMSIALTGKRNELSWNESREEFDFYDIKGLVTGLLDTLKIYDYSLQSANQPYLHPGKSCEIIYNNKVIGTFGEVHPVVQSAYDFNQAVYVLELELEALTAPALLIPQYKHLPKFPGMTRDLAVVVPRDVTMQDLEKVIKENAGPLLQNITVFDIYTGKQIGEGHKSMAFNLTLQAQDRTLTDNEADLIIKKVVNAIQETFAAKLRD